MSATMIATLAAPSGLLTALDRHAAARGRTRAQVLTKAGLVQADWDALAAALGSVNATNVLKLLNASNALLAVVGSSAQIRENLDGTASAVSVGPQHSSSYGDLS